MNKEELKIGRYTENEIFEYLTDGEGNMLGRSMYDAIFDKIHALITENNQLKENNLSMQEEMCRTWEKLNIIKELRSWLEEEINNIETLFGGETSMTIGYKTVLSKLNELEGVNNDR